MRTSVSASAPLCWRGWPKKSRKRIGPFARRIRKASSGSPVTVPRSLRLTITRYFHFQTPATNTLKSFGGFAILNFGLDAGPKECGRSEEHTSELQSRLHLVCRLLLEKKKKNI